jgi:hypothetical protein
LQSRRTAGPLPFPERNRHGNLSTKIRSVAPLPVFLCAFAALREALFSLLSAFAALREIRFALKAEKSNGGRVGIRAAAGEPVGATPLLDKYPARQ